eukprot:Sspe_Gene.33371::Locus_16291_Transcript_1_1_Confidence_1.000_Length_1479::g.33371::m.33371
MPRFFRNNYADRSPASEPLLHNNYPANSRVFFQGRILPVHCVCHHLVQIFESFCLTEDGKPDPIGLQAIWIAPSQASGRIYGYAKFADSRMAANAVSVLQRKVQSRLLCREFRPGEAPADHEVQLLCQLAGALSPPIAVHPIATELNTEWNVMAQGLVRVLHMLIGRVQVAPNAFLDMFGGRDLIETCIQNVEAAAMAKYGEGIITPSVIDGHRGLGCTHTGAAPGRDPVVLDEVSVANDQRPGHRGQNRNKAQNQNPVPPPTQPAALPPSTTPQQQLLRHM